MRRPSKKKASSAFIKKLDPSEHQIQSTLVSILEYKLRPGVVRIALANGGLRHPRVAAMLRAEGVMPGAPDLVFAVENGRVIWLELKTSKGTLSDHQIGMRAKLERLGHVWGMARSVDEALEFLNKHGLLR